MHPMTMQWHCPILPGHQQVQFQGWQRACVHCSNNGEKTPSGCTWDNLWLQSLWSEPML